MLKRLIRGMAQEKDYFKKTLSPDHEYQHAAGFEPAIGMFQEQQFQSLIVALSRFPIVRRIQIKERHCLLHRQREKS
jgi:hypothetical protein